MLFHRRLVDRSDEGLMLSKGCEYGLGAMLCLASPDEEGDVPVGTIRDGLGISFPFPTKIFQKLNDAGLLTSRRGPKGGVALTKFPEVGRVELN